MYCTPGKMFHLRIAVLVYSGNCAPISRSSTDIRMNRRPDNRETRRGGLVHYTRRYTNDYCSEVSLDIRDSPSSKSIQIAYRTPIAHRQLQYRLQHIPYSSIYIISRRVQNQSKSPEIRTTGTKQ